MTKRLHPKKASKIQGDCKPCLSSCQGKKNRQFRRKCAKSLPWKSAARVAVSILFFIIAILTILAIFFDVGNLTSEQKQVFSNVILIGIVSAFFGLFTRCK